MNTRYTPLSAIVLLFLCVPAFSQTLTLDKLAFTPGEKISVTFTAPAGYPDNAWVGIIPSSVPHGSEAVNDQNDLSYQYLQKRTSGVLVFQAPKDPGSYDLRMHNTDSDGKEVAFVSFTVGGTTLSLIRNTFKPGENIVVNFQVATRLPENAWIGIIPSTVPHGTEEVNDQNDIAYQYLGKKTSGSLTFRAPDKSGNYDFRLNESDSGGAELASVSFTVGTAGAVIGKATLKLDRKSYKAGSRITVSFTAPSGLPENAWVGIIPSDVPHGREAVNDQHDVAYQYLKGATSGSMVFDGPTEPGSYDFRMNDTDSDGKEIATVSFTVAR
jgi:hypothetical protein